MTKEKIAIFHNLPNGGGIVYLEHIRRSLSKVYDIDVFQIGEKLNKSIKINKENFLSVTPWKGFVLKNLWIATILKKRHKQFSLKINSQPYKLVIISHDYFTKSPYILRYISASRKIYICHEPQREFFEDTKIHAPYIKDKITTFIRQYIVLIDKKNVKNADIVISNSSYSKGVIDKIYGVNSRVIYPGVDVNMFKPKNISRYRNSILCIGGLSRVKGHDFVIRSLSKIKQSFTVRIVGGGREIDKCYLKKQVEKSDNLKLIIYDHVPTNSLIRLYCKSDMLCIGSHMEPFGLTSIEAQSCGTPVVAVGEGGIPETILDGNTGYITSRDEIKFSKYVEKVLSRRESLSVGARKWVLKKWSWSKTLKPLMSIINSR